MPGTGLADRLRRPAAGWMARRPRRGLARVAFWLVAWFLVLWVLRYLPGTVGGLAAGLQILVGIILFMVGIPLFWTHVRPRLLWSLRNKLIITYVLIGLAPVVLLGTLVLVTAYVAAGQFAIHLVDARVQQELNRMSAENAFRLGQLVPVVESHATSEALTMPLPPEQRPPGVERFAGSLPRATTCFLDGTSIFQPSANRATPFGMPPWMSGRAAGRFHGIVADGGDLFLVAAEQRRLRDGRLFTVVDSTPMDAPSVALLAEGLGIVRLHPEQQQGSADAVTASAEDAEAEKVARKGQHILSEIRGGVKPPAHNRADIGVRFPSTLAMTNWARGDLDNLVIEVESRPSRLYQQLFGASLSGWVINVIRISLAILFLVFAAIELVAFSMAVGLSRTMTESIAGLYNATQRIDRGDLEHTIAVTGDDQLAELSRSFNTMTGSLQRLLIEQKEKERLQSELSIAQQVQANLFPVGIRGISSLELHGVCRPARSVSGDYYDFLIFHEDVATGAGKSARREAGVGIAIGDISGKGISAALLMATLHSAVRAYQFAGEELVFAHSTLEALTASKEGIADAGGWFRSPGRIMSLLNRHLFRSTPPEKYATLFLAHYDASSCELTFSNAGQLPPFILCKDGSVRRLEEGGTVVGLMDGMHFDEGRARMHPGDILIAYSDGVTEPENDFGDFGETRLLEVVNRYRAQPLHVISEQVMLALDAWIGAEEQPDDITLVLARQV